MKRTWMFAAALIGSTLSANAQKDSSKSTLDDVVVTATKTPKKLSETGKVLTVISREQLERSGGKDLAQVLNEQTGVIVNGSSSNPGKDKSIYLRGARADYTVILIDGIPVYDPSGIGGNFDIRLLPIQNIDHIEILKGSQSTLYGSDAVAGVINIITKKSGTKPIGLFGSAAYGSFNTFKGSAGINGHTDIIDYSAGYTYNDTKGITEAADKDHTGNFDKDGFTENAANLNLGINIRKGWKLSPYLRWSQLEGDLDYDAFADDEDYTYRNKNLQAGLRNEIKFGGNTIQLNYNYNNNERKYVNDSGFINPVAFDQYSSGKYTGKEHFAEALYAGNLCKSVQIVAGADLRHSNTGQDYLSVSPFGNYTETVDKDLAKQTQYSGYASLLYTGKIFHAEAGGRYNHHSTYGDKFTYNFNPFVLLNQEIKIFANISSAYKTPSLYQLYSQYGNLDLKPEYATTYEAGFAYKHPSNVFAIRVVGFARDVKDVLAFYTDYNTYESYYINQDKQKDKGVEVEPSLSINKVFQLKLNYTYTDGKITTQQSGKDTSYFNLTRRPKHAVNVFAGYQVTKAFYVSASLQSLSKRTDNYFNPSTFTSEQIELKGYALLNAYASYQLFAGKLNIFVDAKNLTDKTDYYEVYGFGVRGFNVMGGVQVKL